jgi:hypothetical protein
MAEEIPNEEEVQEEAAPKKTTRKTKKVEEPSVVVFRSRNKEPREFQINGIRARRNVEHPGRCEWHVPGDKAEAFERHFHIVRGRVLRVKD